MGRLESQELIYLGSLAVVTSSSRGEVMQEPDEAGEPCLPEVGWFPKDSQGKGEPE